MQQASLLSESYHHEQVLKTSDILRSLERQGEPVKVKTMFNELMRGRREERADMDRVMNEYRLDRLSDHRKWRGLGEQERVQAKKAGLQ